jgi:hypothetical protein
MVVRLPCLALGLAAWSHFAPSAPGADVSYYSVAKGILFTQTNNDPPALRSGLPYVFQAVVMPPTNLITSARVQWSLADLALAPITTPPALGFVQRVPTQDSLDATFPNGSFRIAMQTVNDGGHTGNLSIAGNDYPAPPALLNMASVQGVNAALPFTLQWSAFVGGTLSDFIFVQVENSVGRVFSTGNFPGAAGALNGIASLVVIPANTLQPGHAYTVRIVFHRFSTMNQLDYPGVVGTGGYFSQTDFYLTTAGGGDITPPALVSTSPLAGETNVPINTPVVFRFSEQMSRGIALGIAGTTASRTFDWSPDSRVLVATPTTNWPPNATIFWTLNLYYTQLAFGDLNGNALPMETVLSFTTGTNVAPIPAPSLFDPKQLPNDRFQFVVLGQNNRSYVVQASSNLVNWVSLNTNVAFTGEFEFLDTNAPAFPRRYYRAFAR